MVRLPVTSLPAPSCAGSIASASSGSSTGNARSRSARSTPATSSAPALTPATPSVPSTASPPPARCSRRSSSAPRPTPIACSRRSTGCTRRSRASCPRTPGRCRPARPYSAFEPELMLWTIAPAADSAVYFYELFVRELSEAERDAFWADYVRFGELFGMPASVAPALLGRVPRLRGRQDQRPRCPPHRRGPLHRLGRDVRDPDGALALARHAGAQRGDEGLAPAARPRALPACASPPPTPPRANAAVAAATGHAAADAALRAARPLHAVLRRRRRRRAQDARPRQDGARLAAAARGRDRQPSATPDATTAATIRNAVAIRRPRSESRWPSQARVPLAVPTEAAATAAHCIHIETQISADA